MQDVNRYAGLVGSSVGLLLIALSYLGERLLMLPFLPFALFDWLARAMPGSLITLGIDIIVDSILLFNLGESTSITAKLIEQMMALLQFPVLTAVPEQEASRIDLTDQEVVILRLLGERCSNAEISERLVVTEGTVKWHLHNIYGKLGVKNRCPAVARARVLG